MLSVTALNARQGDALWVRWGDQADQRQLLVDMGTEGVGRSLAQRLLTLPEDRRRFELLVVTHVDRDHIGGVLTCLADDDAPEIPGLAFEDVWFNGWPHLHGGRVAVPGGPPDRAGPALEPMGPAQGERLAGWLEGRRWNAAFDGSAVARTPGQAPASVILPGDLVVTVLGPTPERLSQLAPTWRDEVAIALERGQLDRVSPGLEPMGPRTPPDLESVADLEDLAASHQAEDGSPANGASIVLLVRHRDRSMLLTGDAFGADVVAGIEAVSSGSPLALDVVKLPHHGSQYNVTASLVAAVDPAWWLVSSDGTQFRHPDPPAIARVLLGSRTRPTQLAFNAPSQFNGWWDNATWQDRFRYQTRCGTTDDGLTLSFA
jgi:Metallo-beta-lactamase superfamily